MRYLLLPTPMVCWELNRCEGSLAQSIDQTCFKKQHQDTQALWSINECLEPALPTAVLAVAGLGTVSVHRCVRA